MTQGDRSIAQSGAQNLKPWFALKAEIRSGKTKQSCFALHDSSDNETKMKLLCEKYIRGSVSKLLSNQVMQYYKEIFIPDIN